MKYDIDKLFEEYHIRKNNAKLLIDQVKDIIHTGTKKDNIKIHHIFNRIKEFDSFLDKIRRKGLNDPFNEVHDLIGFRIICLYMEDIDKIGLLLREWFDIFDIENKVDEASPKVFGYMASHYKAKLNDKDIINGIPKDYSFEIQIRTIAQDAWASISHHLFYKHETHLPANLERDFYALSGLFYIADTHFLLLKKEQTELFLNEFKEKSE
jgi:putative GTP pyrophosphokinase